MQKYLVEFIGAGVLFCAVVGSGIMASNLSLNNEGVVLLANTLATSFALYFLIKTFQEYGDAHFNPAVSMVAYLKKELSNNYNLKILENKYYKGNILKKQKHFFMIGKKIIT